MKLPPSEKILEAWSAIGSGRVRLLSQPEAESGEAEVLSSDSNKIYKLSWDGDMYRSNDAATIWQGYPGYPVLAVLMERGLLPLPTNITRILAPLNWNKLNKEFKRNYEQATAQAFKELKLDPQTIESIDNYKKETADILKTLTISLGRYRKPRKEK